MRDEGLWWSFNSVLSEASGSIGDAGPSVEGIEAWDWEKGRASGGVTGISSAMVSWSGEVMFASTDIIKEMADQRSLK